MDKIFYLKDSEKFWETRKKARKIKDRKLEKLNFSEKVNMAEKIEADYEVLQNAKRESSKFEIGEIPGAVNELSIENNFDSTEFEENSKKEFPFTRELQEAQINK